MRREHWVGLTALWLGMWAAGRLAAEPADRPLPSFVRQAQAVAPVPTPASTPAPVYASPQQVVLPPGTSIIVPPDGTGGRSPLFPGAGGSGGCAECQRAGAGQPADGKKQHPHRLCKAVSRLYFGLIEPSCGTDGCLMPLGCSNFHLEFVYIFGSCRQFHGNGTAAPPSLLKPPPPKEPTE